jgi:hypothetical protein
VPLALVRLAIASIAIGAVQSALVVGIYCCVRRLNLNQFSSTPFHPPGCSRLDEHSDLEHKLPQLQRDAGMDPFCEPSLSDWIQKL